MVSDGAVLDPLGVLEESRAGSDIKNNRPQGTERLADIISQNPASYLEDLKKGVAREAEKVRVSDILQMVIEFREQSNLKKVTLADGRPLISCIHGE